jgi:N-acetylmuramoyl-L-alanine amidase
MSASAHLFCDDRDIVECIPALSTTPEKAWHVRYECGRQYNDHYIGVELCYGGRINLEEAYKRYVYTMAYICHRYDVDPDTIVGHYALDPKRKTDPQIPLKMLKKTIDDLREDVKKELIECSK